MWWRRVRYVLLLMTLCAIATCPSAKRACTTNAQVEEAEQLLTYAADRITAVYAATGKLPDLAAGPTPSTPCCDQDGTCAPDPVVWSTPAWTALGFSIDDPHRYVYQYVPDPSGASATVRAVGDLDCDGASALYEVTLTVSAGKLVRTWNRKSPRE